MDITTLGPHLVRITLTGRLDAPSVERIETQFIASLVPGANSAVVDLTDVDFVASMGIRMLVLAANSLRTRKAAIAVYGAQERVLQAFDAVSLEQILSICATAEEALTAVGAPTQK